MKTHDKIISPHLSILTRSSRATDEPVYEYIKGGEDQTYSHYKVPSKMSIIFPTTKKFKKIMAQQQIRELRARAFAYDKVPRSNAESANKISYLKSYATVP